MSKKGSITTSDYLEWEVSTNLVRRLYKDGNYRMSLLIGCGTFFGLRIGDLRTLKWSQILHNDEILITEHKTQKRRIIKINKDFQEHIRKCHDSLHITNDEEPCFLSRQGGVMTIQVINHHLKTIRVKYKLKIDHFSTHSFRKTWGRKIYENECSQGRGELSLVKLSELMNHSSPAITRRYLGIRQEELSEVYENLDF